MSKGGRHINIFDVWSFNCQSFAEFFLEFFSYRFYMPTDGPDYGFMNIEGTMWLPMSLTDEEIILVRNYSKSGAKIYFCCKYKSHNCKAKLVMLRRGDRPILDAVFEYFDHSAQHTCGHELDIWHFSLISPRVRLTIILTQS